MAGVVLLLLGTVGPTYAQQDQHKQDARPPKQEQPNQNRPQQGAQRPQPNQNRPQQQGAQRPQPNQNRPQQQGAQRPQPNQNRPQQQGAQRPQPNQNRPQQQGAQRPQPNQNRPQQQGAQRPQPNQNRPQQQGAQGRQPNRPSRYGPPVQRADERNAWQRYRARDWQSQHRTWQQRGGYDGYRIPDNRYGLFFGPSHVFRLFSFNLYIFGGYPRFWYGGYWISLLDPWPPYWGDDWYQNDDVYIEYSGDGYYLYNRRYPQDRIAVMIYLN